MHKSILKFEDRQRLSPAYFKESLQEFYIKKKNCKHGHVYVWTAVCPLGEHFIYSLCGSQRLERRGRQRNQELNCKLGKAQAMSRDQLCLEEMGQTFRQGDLGFGSCKMCRFSRWPGEKNISDQREQGTCTSVEEEIISCQCSFHWVWSVMRDTHLWGPGPDSIQIVPISLSPTWQKGMWTGRWEV